MECQPQRASEVNSGLKTMGHFHPLLVHLPIGFLLLATFMDLLAYRQSWAQFRAAVPFTLLLGVVAALLSCGSGYLLAQSGSYDYDTLGWHQWAAWATAALSGVLWIYSVFRFRKNPASGHAIFTGSLLLLGALVAFTGHQGGSLTHGGGYWNWNQQSVEAKEKAAQQTIVDSASLRRVKLNPDLPQNVDAKAIERLGKLGLNVRYMLKKPVMLDISLPAQSGLSPAALDSALQILAPAVVWLNLADNGFKEADLQVLEQCKNLEKLRLEKNPIGDGIVKLVQNLKHLEAINLNETQVNAAAIEQLKKAGIKRVYAWKVNE